MNPPSSKSKESSAELTASVTSHFCSDEAILLPATYEPSEFDVVCGRGRGNYNASGNVIFRRIVREAVDDYLSQKTKTGKTLLLGRIADRVRSQDSGRCRFVKLLDNGSWVEMGFAGAHEKVGHAMREVLAARRKKERAMSKEKEPAMATTTRTSGARGSPGQGGQGSKQSSNKSLKSTPIMLHKKKRKISEEPPTKNQLSIIGTGTVSVEESAAEAAPTTNSSCSKKEVASVARTNLLQKRSSPSTCCSEASSTSCGPPSSLATTPPPEEEGDFFLASTDSSCGQLTRPHHPHHQYCLNNRRNSKKYFEVDEDDIAPHQQTFKRARWLSADDEAHDETMFELGINKDDFEKTMLPSPPLSPPIPDAGAGHGGFPQLSLGRSHLFPASSSTSPFPSTQTYYQQHQQQSQDDAADTYIRGHTPSWFTAQQAQLASLLPEELQRSAIMSSSSSCFGADMLPHQQQRVGLLVSTTPATSVPRTGNSQTSSYHAGYDIANNAPQDFYFMTGRDHQYLNIPLSTGLYEFDEWLSQLWW